MTQEKIGLIVQFLLSQFMIFMVIFVLSLTTLLNVVMRFSFLVSFLWVSFFSLSISLFWGEKKPPQSPFQKQLCEVNAGKQAHVTHAGTYSWVVAFWFWSWGASIDWNHNRIMQLLSPRSITRVFCFHSTDFRSSPHYKVDSRVLGTEWRGIIWRNVVVYPTGTKYSRMWTAWRWPVAPACTFFVLNQAKHLDKIKDPTETELLTCKTLEQLAALSGVSFCFCFFPLLLSKASTVWHKSGIQEKKAKKTKAQTQTQRKAQKEIFFFLLILRIFIIIWIWRNSWTSCKKDKSNFSSVQRTGKQNKGNNNTTDLSNFSQRETVFNNRLLHQKLQPQEHRKKIRLKKKKKKKKKRNKPTQHQNQCFHCQANEEKNGLEIQFMKRRTSNITVQWNLEKLFIPLERVFVQLCQEKLMLHIIQLFKILRNMTQSMHIWDCSLQERKHFLECNDSRIDCSGSSSTETASKSSSNFFLVQTLDSIFLEDLLIHLQQNCVLFVPKVNSLNVMFVKRGERRKEIHKSLLKEKHLLDLLRMINCSKQFESKELILMLEIMHSLLLIHGKLQKKSWIWWWKWMKVKVKVVQMKESLILRNILRSIENRKLEKWKASSQERNHFVLDALNKSSHVVFVVVMTAFVFVSFTGQKILVWMMRKFKHLH